MKNETITTDELARMIQEDVVAHMATKTDVAELRQDMNKRFDLVEERLDIVENRYGRRLDKVEDDMRLVKTKLGIA